MLYRYSLKERAEIGNYAVLHSVPKVTRTFSCKWKVRLGETTVRSIRDGYQEKLKRRRHSGNDTPLHKFPELQRGRPLLLGEALDHKLKLYVKKIRDAGGVISTKIVMAAAHGLLLAYDQSKLAEFGRHIALNYHWAYAFLC